MMIRLGMAVLAGFLLGLGGFTLASHKAQGHGKVTPISERDVIETLNGKEARVTMVEVAYEPGEGSVPHRHAGPIFGYVLEGEYELGLDEQSTKILKAGDTFYEPTGILHRVSRNPSTKTRTRVLAVQLHPRDAKPLTVPEPGSKAAN